MQTITAEKKIPETTICTAVLQPQKDDANQKRLLSGSCFTLSFSDFQGKWLRTNAVSQVKKRTPPP
jgi:hypothetical protein